MNNIKAESSFSVPIAYNKKKSATTIIIKDMTRILFTEIMDTSDIMTSKVMLILYVCVCVFFFTINFIC